METPTVFIIIFGSGHFSGREVCEKSSSVTTHRLPRNVTAMIYEFAIIQQPKGQLYIKRDCEQIFSIMFKRLREMERE